MINLPTRQINISFSLLDNIYTNIPHCYNTCTIGVLKFLTQSDHYPIFTIRNKIEPPKPKAEITKRKRSSKNIALFRKQIKRSDWGSLYNNENIEAAFSIFIKPIVSTFQKCFPIEIIKLNHKNRNPWINQTLKDDIKKDIIYFCYVKSILVWNTNKNTNNSEIEILMSKGKLRETITQKNLSLIKMILRNHGKLFKI